MSTHWGFTCKTCEEYSSTWINHGEEMLREFFKIAPKLNKILSETDLDIEFNIMGFGWNKDFVSDALQFLAFHKGHQISLRNEYGDVEPL